MEPQRRKAPKYEKDSFMLCLQDAVSKACSLLCLTGSGTYS